MSPAILSQTLIITGPTGSGKTGLGVHLAERLNGEIISMDSMALYRGMDIGTAKPGKEDQQRIRHHLIDVLNPWESSSVAWWLKEAERSARDILNRGKKVVLVGGTALYLKALLYGLFKGPPEDPEVRQRLNREAESFGKQALHARLHAIDPATATRLHPHDVRRIVRALEVWELTGEPMSGWQRQWRKPLQQTPAAWWIDLPRQELYARIDGRVARMFDAGWVEEVRGLQGLLHPLSREAQQALGYKEIIEHLSGRLNLAETMDLVRTRTRQFAKRQLTWFRHLPGCRPCAGELTSEDFNRTMAY